LLCQFQHGFAAWEFIVRVLTVALLFALVPVWAACAEPAPPAGFGLWSPAHLQEVGARLDKELGDKNMVFETLGTYKGHSVYLVLRGRTAPAEFHETEEDIQIGVRGTATFVIGGELIEPRKLPRKQQQGSGIKGGAKFPVGPGDVVHVPTAVPHVLLIEPNKPYLYILIKLDEEPRNDPPK
jgi:mannose-6-phosphate isomerase-like protein (cupin superfamily)